MNHSTLIQAIKKQKQEIRVSVLLKQESQRFTQLLFNALFDYGTDAVNQVFPPIILFSPITVSPPKIEALA